MAGFQPSTNGRFWMSTEDFATQLGGLESVRDYLRQCIYDSVAEWQARAKTSRIDSDTIKLLKDRLLRVPLEMESHAADEGTVEAPSS